MHDPSMVITVCVAYMGLLFLVALFAERRAAIGRSLTNNPVVYSLSWAVYCTAWTFYGSVGKAANAGMLFVAIYLGPTMALILAWSILPKLIRIKETYRITSIADLISSRYDKSQTVAALATLIVLIGVTPYIALQLKAVVTTFAVITTGDAPVNPTVSLVLVGMIILFTIVFGIRRVDPTRRHQGMVLAVSVESVVKLVAFLAVGIYVTYVLFDGFGPLIEQFSRSSFASNMTIGGTTDESYLTWLSYILLSMSAILFLPRQFHISVIENFQKKHIRTAMWLFPLYLFAISLFVIPIAMAGLLSGYPASQADTFVLRLPLDSGQRTLSLLVFLGGFSAAASMVMISTMTTSTMVVNHLMMPLILRFRQLGFLRRHLVPLRWVVAAGGIAGGYVYATVVAGQYLLVNIGIMSFAAVLQFAPVILGGLYWRRGNKAGALLGMGSGFFIWAYTMLVPALASTGMISQDVVTTGPWGVGFLAPENLFGVTLFDPVTNAVFWSLFFNVSLYVVGSYVIKSSTQERRIAEEFVNIFVPGNTSVPPVVQEATIDLVEKSRQMEEVLLQYFSRTTAKTILERSILEKCSANAQCATIVQLAEVYNDVERNLAGSIGAPAAHTAMRLQKIFTGEETRVLASTYADILADMRVPPQELKRRIDYHQEREALLQEQSQAMSHKVSELQEEIDAREKIEAALQASEKKYRLLVDNASEGVLVVQDGMIRFVNASMASIVGYSEVEVIDKSMADFLHPEDREMVLTRHAARVQGLAAPNVYGFRVIDRNGATRWVEINVVVIDWGDHKASLGFITDITEKKQAAEEKNRLENQLRQAQKMEAIGTLAGGIAHDFNNILSAVFGFTELAGYKAQAGKDCTNELEEVLKAGDRARDLVQQILSFSRQTDQERQPIQLAPIIQEALKLLRASLPTSIEIQSNITANNDTIIADATQFHQVLMNLCTNAGHAMRDTGGVLTLKLESVVLDQEEVSFYPEIAPGSYQRLTISDTGHGMNAATLERIFDPFFTTKEQGEGTGLGLSTVHGIVASHGGAIGVDSEPGRGTSFRIVLPLAGEDDLPEEEREEASKQFETGTERILFVDDEAMLVKIAERILSQLGYRVTAHTSSVEALEQFKAEPDQFDLVITDMTMPKMTGVKLSREIRQIRPTMPIILCTGFSEQLSPHSMKELGIDRIVLKPFVLDEFSVVIRQVLDGEDNSTQEPS